MLTTGVYVVVVVDDPTASTASALVGFALYVVCLALLYVVVLRQRELTDRKSGISESASVRSMGATVVVITLTVSLLDGD